MENVTMCCSIRAPRFNVLFMQPFLQGNWFRRPWALTGSPLYLCFVRKQNCQTWKWIFCVSHLFRMSKRKRTMRYFHYLSHVRKPRHKTQGTEQNRLHPDVSSNSNVYCLSLVWYCVQVVALCENSLFFSLLSQINISPESRCKLRFLSTLKRNLRSC